MVLFHLIYNFDCYLIIETWKLFIKFEYQLFVMRCAIWYHLYNLKNKKKKQWRSVTFSKPTTLLKVTFLHGCFSYFLNCTNGTKSRKLSQFWIYFSSYSKVKWVRSILQIVLCHQATRQLEYTIHQILR